MQRTALVSVVIVAIIATTLTVSLQASGQNYNIPDWIKNNANGGQKVRLATKILLKELNT